MAIINNEWKIVKDPVAGQCPAEHGSVFKGTMLFNLNEDPTESNDLSKDPAHADLYANMSAQLVALAASIEFSAANESQCSVGAGPTPPGPAPPGPVRDALVHSRSLAFTF